MTTLRRCLGLAALLFVMVGTLGLGQEAQRARAATQDQEYAAVQSVVGSAVDAQQLLYPVMNATGSEAIADAAVLHFTADGFLAAQGHPAQMMDAIQRFFRTLGAGSEQIYVIENVNSNLNLLDLYGVDPQTQADVITRIITYPLATSYLWTYDRQLEARAYPAVVSCPKNSSTCTRTTWTTAFTSGQMVAVWFEFNHPVQGSLILELKTPAQPCQPQKAPCEFVFYILHKTTHVAYTLGNAFTLTPTYYSKNPAACSTTRTYDIYVNHVTGQSSLGEFALSVSTPATDWHRLHHWCTPGT